MPDQPVPNLNTAPNPEAAPEQPGSAHVLKHCLVSVILYGLLLLVLAINPWFHRGLLSIKLGEFTGLQIYCGLYAVYVVAALPVYLALRPASLLESKNLLILGVLQRILKRVLPGGAAQSVNLSQKEQYALTFLVVKLFFGPLMLNSALIDYHACKMLWGFRKDQTLMAWMDWGYILFVHAIFMIDSCLFFVGYHTEAGFLRNRIQHVETNPWHILVCVICYPPFNMATSAVLGPSAYDPYILVLGDGRSAWTWILRAAAVLFLLVLICSSGSLFTKASNLTHRGIVTWGPYRFVRHPGYLAKNLFWLMTLIPTLIPFTSSSFFSWPTYLISCLCTLSGILAWGTIYYLRAITEERFLSRDPEYVAYCRKVKWRFIPGVY
jgi:protein-S-isoprenylcysteine O-methyltransferase Ste14